MERILIRAGVAPWAEYNALDVITDKIIGNNTGNLLFPTASPGWWPLRTAEWTLSLTRCW